jgi:hypothetical protein
LSDGEFLKERQERALPVLEAFKKWLDEQPRGIATAHRLT